MADGRALGFGHGIASDSGVRNTARSDARLSSSASSRAPSATGALAATPLAHALVYARNKRLSGTFDLLGPEGLKGSIEFRRGRIRAARTVPATCYFGTVVYERGWIDAIELGDSLREVAQTRRLHGEILLAHGAITAAQRDQALVEHICQNVHHLFTLPATETTFAFYDAERPSLYGPERADAGIDVEPLAPVWRGICHHPPEDYVREVLARVGKMALRMINEAAILRIGLTPEESALCKQLADRPLTLGQLRARATALPTGRADLFAYLLVIAKCVEMEPPTQSQQRIPAVSVGSGEVRAAARAFEALTAMAPPPPRPSQHVTIPAPASSAPTAPATAHTTSSGSMPAARPSAGQQPATTGPLPPPRTASSPAVPAPMLPSSHRGPAGAPPSWPAPGRTRSSGSMPAAPYSSGSAWSSVPAPASGEMRRPPSFQIPSVPAPPPMPSEVGDVGQLTAQLITERAQRVDDEDYFTALGVDEAASVEAVRAAYFRLAKIWHPTRLPSELASFEAEAQRVFVHLTNAHRTLTDSDARRGYIATRGAKSAELKRPRKEVMAIIEHAISRRDFAMAERESRRLSDLDPEDAEALALLAWAGAQAGDAAEETLRAAVLKMDRVVHLDRYCDRAYFLRGMLHKRLGNGPAAHRDFARAVQVNSKHVDAAREVRLYEMRTRKAGLSGLFSKAKGLGKK